jgi:hypothetical protein
MNELSRVRVEDFSAGLHDRPKLGQKRPFRNGHNWNGCEAVCIPEYTAIPPMAECPGSVLGVEVVVERLADYTGFGEVISGLSSHSEGPRSRPYRPYQSYR